MSFSKMKNRHFTSILAIMCSFLMKSKLVKEGIRYFLLNSVMAVRIGTIRFLSLLVTISRTYKILRWVCKFRCYFIFIYWYPFISLVWVIDIDCVGVEKLCISSRNELQGQECPYLPVKMECNPSLWTCKWKIWNNSWRFILTYTLVKP